MITMRFEWDERKNVVNQRKHGVSFEEAASVFYDENGRFKSDPDHSENEERFILLGVSSKLRFLVVCHCYGEKDEVIRIISAREAAKRERGEYMEFLS
ncbi:MAG: BrnT family toxin [Candidatus Omnitrophica bacterium]|nr:BrnT family toxin [Candidatus Omnitrophota bacterium]